ncbi:ArsR/SmtB family transcription factor [Streptomyces griseoaurantiacus]|uniref:ArsR/SmtB family transcription factor n=1 Tax=Streptomyces griseoaurantiacus TaxID=68213 RepID=UPI002E2C0F57|nr:winged helix-turn-helix domain-containing protein [Streptomyces jietaisiensis]
MKRIHFTAEDLARTRVAATIGVAAETFDTVRLAQDRGSGLAFRRWRVAVRGRLDERVAPVAALTPARGPVVDAASLMGDTASLDEAVENLMAAPRALLRLELEVCDPRSPHRTWVQSLMDGDREPRRQLAAALRVCHGVTVAPYWGGVRSHLDEVRAGYVAAMAEGGVGALLAAVCPPMVRWRPPVLEFDHPREADVHLNGRGLVIAPAMFSTQQIELLQAPLDPGRAPVLAVPTGDAPLDSTLWEAADGSAAPSLDELLGRTRAAILAAVVTGCGTTEPARRLRVSPATVSHHATVLRGARLITTRREGKAVLHTATSLGLALLGRSGRPGAL